MGWLLSVLTSTPTNTGRKALHSYMGVISSPMYVQSVKTGWSILSHKLPYFHFHSTFPLHGCPFTDVPLTIKAVSSIRILDAWTGFCKAPSCLSQPALPHSLQPIRYRD